MLHTAPTATAHPTYEVEKEVADNAIVASATDTRGIIRYANDAFCEISGYTTDQLRGAPHKTLRHPDMPKGLFYLLWDRIKEGKPGCVYIKNRASDGRSYWVYSTLTRASDGFVSISIKPQADMLAMTCGIYEDLRAAEAEGLSPERSAARMRELLAAQGFADIGIYMRATLDAEIALRPDIAEVAGGKLHRIDELTGLIETAEALTDQIGGAFQQVRGEPVNLRILAGRMEEAGAAISTISKNYETMSTDMYQSVKRLNGSGTAILAKMRTSIDRGRCAGQIAALMQMARPDGVLDAQTPAEPLGDAMLADQCEELERNCHAALLEIASCGRTIPDICRQLRRRIKGLDLVKLLCRVESGRMGDRDNGLNGIISRLEDAHETKDRLLAELSNIASQIDKRSREL